MKNHPFTQCIIPRCGRTYDVREIRTECESCGNLLDVNYRSYVSPKLKDVFYERRNHEGNIFNESGVWRFRELINFVGINTEDYGEYSKILVSLDGDEGKTKPFHLTKVAEHVGLQPDRFWLQFEGSNPTGSFKDNGMATAFTHAKMLGTKKVSCASTGNTASSAAAFAANEWMEAIIFVGEGKIAKGKLAQILDYGARVVQIKGDFDDAMARIMELAKKKDVYIVNSVNPYRIEGQKTMMYRVLDYLEWDVPDWIVFPGGNLGNTSAFGKAFMELHKWGWLKRIPRMAVVNAEGANTFHTLFNEKNLRWNNGNVDDATIENYHIYLKRHGIRAKTKASAIEILKPVNLKKALRTLEFTNGIVTEVSDKKMLDARAVVGRNGFGCELASAATVAGIKKLVKEEIIEKDETVVGILTGHMLKDPDTIIDYHMDSKNKFANTPVVVENDADEIARVVRSARATR